MTALATLLADPEQPIAFVVRFDERDPDTDTVTTVNLQTANRAGTEGYPSLLSDPGGRSDKLEADELEAIAAQTVAPVKLRNEPTAPGVDGPLDYLRNRSLAGRDITILAGSPTEAIANYEAVATGVMDREPVFDGSVVEIRIKSPLERLNVDLDVGTYVGEPGALKILTSTGVAATADNAAHHLTDFTLAYRFRQAAGYSGSPVYTSRGTSAAARNWRSGLGFSGGGQVGQVIVSWSSGGVAGNRLESGTRYDDGEDHVVVIARNDDYAYLMIDGVVVAELDSPPVPDLPTSGIVMADVLESSDNRFLDHRIYNHYIAPDEMRAAMAVRADGGESGLVGLWRANEVTGTTMTDYSPTAAHATISGTEGIDFEHVSSDLGTEELAGRSMPAFVGHAWHSFTDLVNSVFERIRWNDRDVTASTSAATGVRDEGELLESVDHDWDASSFSAATFGLVSEPGEPVTVGYGAANNSGPDVVLPALMVDRGPLTNSEIALHRFKALYTVDMGIATRRRSLREVVSEAVAGGLGYIGVGVDGVLNIDALVPPTSPSPRDGACLEIVGDTTDTAAVTWSSLSNPITGTDFTVAAWVKLHRSGPSFPTVSQQVNVILVSRSAIADPVIFAVDTSTGVPQILLRRDGSNIAFSGFGNLFAGFGEWHFLAASHDAGAGTVSFYGARQGESLALLGTDASTHVAAPGSTEITAGPREAVLSTSEEFYGSVFEPQIWNGALSVVDLQALMDAAPAGTEPDLAFYASLAGNGVAARTDAVSSTVGVTSGDVREVPDLVLDLRTDPKVYRSRQFRPAHTIEVEYRRNFAVLDPSNIAATVPQDEALDLQTPARFERWSDPDIAADHLDAREVSIPALWSTREGAQAALRIARYRFAPGRELADLIDAGRRAILLGLGDEVRVYGSRWDLDTGPVFRVAANNVRLGELTCDLGLWR